MTHIARNPNARRAIVALFASAMLAACSTPTDGDAGTDTPGAVDTRAQDAGCTGTACGDAPTFDTGLDVPSVDASPGDSSVPDAGTDAMTTCDMTACRAFCTRIGQSMANCFLDTCYCAAATCTSGMTSACSIGPRPTTGIGRCTAGMANCTTTGIWDLCTGERGPTGEVCNGMDDDCDGMTDEVSDVDCAVRMGSTHVTAGGAHSAVIPQSGTASGQVYTWGSNTRGELGNGDAAHRNQPAAVGPVMGLSGTINEVVGGTQHTCARRGGSIFCWGSNGSGQLGTGSVGSSRVDLQACKLEYSIVSPK